MERLIDPAAAETGIDRLELRRRNHIRPNEIPYKAPSGHDLRQRRLHRRARAGARSRRLAGLRQRASARASKRGKLRGLGIGYYLEVTAPPNKEMGGIRFEADGTVTIITGTLDYGQGHATPFAQVLTERLGIPFERIRLLQGDSDQLIAGGGTGGSRSIMASGTAIVEAADKVIEQGKQIAAPRARGLGGRHRVRARPLRHRRHRPRDRHHGAGREAARRHRSCRRTCRNRSTSSTSRRRRRPPSRTAATSPRSRSIRTPARSRS